MDEQNTTRARLTGAGTPGSPDGHELRQGSSAPGSLLPAELPRPRWVEVDNGTRFAILIKIVGHTALVRWPDAHGGYAWRSLAGLTRRRDLDAHPDPEWLQRARSSRRPPAALWWLLGKVPAPPDTLDPNFDDCPQVPMFDTDADGRPL